MFTEEDYKKLKNLIILQLKKLNINLQDYEDYIQEIVLYILNRKHEIKLDDKFIYGDIRNGIINYFKKDIKFKNIILVNDIDNIKKNKIILQKQYNIDFHLLRDELKKYEYGYLFYFNKIEGFTVKELSFIYNLKKDKIYYEINKIKDKINWVYS